MRLMRLGPASAERPALRNAQGRHFDLSGLAGEIDTLGTQTAIFAEA